MAPFNIPKRKRQSVSLSTQSIIQQKGKHNALRTEDGKIPCGYKVGEKTNLKRQLKAKQTALLFVWISQLTGMSRDQFLMMNIGQVRKHSLGGSTGDWSHHQRPQNRIPGRHPGVATEYTKQPPNAGENFLRRVRENGGHPFRNSFMLQAAGLKWISFVLVSSCQTPYPCMTGTKCIYSANMTVP